MKRHPKLKYTEMCIYIDAHIYEENHDVEKIFDYLRMLFYALASKKRFFNNEKDYDEYSLYAATRLYMRLVNKNQFLPEDDPKHIPKVKSVLNFIKRILYPLKVNYQQENYNGILGDEIQGDGLYDGVSKSFQQTLDQTESSLLQVEVTEYFNHIPKTIKHFLSQSPYCRDRKVMHNIYISCLLTLLRSITLSNINHQRLLKREDKGNVDIEELLPDMMHEEKLNAPICWHLDKGMESYINVLTTKIQKLIINDIRDLIQSYQPSQEIIKDILMEPLSECNEDNND